MLYLRSKIPDITNNMERLSFKIGHVVHVEKLIKTVRIPAYYNFKKVLSKDQRI